jgi:signal transduction histidine kinase
MRLTVTYAAVLVLTSAVLLGLNYALLYHSLYAEPGLLDGAAVLNDKLAQHMAEVDDLRARTLLNTAGMSAWALAAVAVVGLGASWAVAGRLLRPLRTLTATTRQISQDRLHERVALSGPRDELKELADTFDAMVARLEHSFAGQRRFSADAAHELRSALTVVRTGAEVILAKRESTIDQWETLARRQLLATDQAERLLDGLLALARSDSDTVVAQAADLSAAAAVALGDADEAAEAAGVTVGSDLLPAPVAGDPVLLDRLVRNLVDNAVRHNHRGGWIEVTTGHRPDASYVVVRNSGEAIPPNEVDRLFEPFQRLDANRAATGSSGLGLAIVRSIVRAHHGTVTAEPLPAGGLLITVTLPEPPKLR